MVVTLQSQVGAVGKNNGGCHRRRLARIWPTQHPKHRWREIFLDVYERPVSFEPDAKNLQQRVFDTYAAEVACVDRNGDGITSAEVRYQRSVLYIRDHAAKRCDHNSLFVRAMGRPVAVYDRIVLPRLRRRMCHDAVLTLYTSQLVH